MTLRRPLSRPLPRPLQWALTRPALSRPGFVLLSALVLVMLFGLAGQALAAAPGVAPAATPAPMATANPSAGNLLQTIFALCVVLGLLGILAWVLKRYGPKQTTGSANLRIVGALNLGGRERIMVVEVGDQWIVVGASSGRVNALATLPKQDAPATIQLDSYQPSASSFAEWLKQTIEKRK